MTLDDNQQEMQQATQQTTTVVRDAGAAADDTTVKLKSLNKEFLDTSKTIKDSFSKSISDAINGTNTFAASFDKIRKSLEDLAIKTAITNPLSDFLFGSVGKNARLDSVQSVNDVLPAQGRGGLLGDLTNGIADLFGARAFGGPVGAGQPYLVGERGPELFVPQTAGRINPDIGGTVSIVMNITANDAASFQASQTQIAASMIDAARRAQRIR